MLEQLDAVSSPLSRGRVPPSWSVSGVSGTSLVSGGSSVTIADAMRRKRCLILSFSKLLLIFNRETSCLLGKRGGPDDKGKTGITGGIGITMVKAKWRLKLLEGINRPEEKDGTE